MTPQSTDQSDLRKELHARFETVLNGSFEVLDLLMTSVLAGGHVLLDDAPGDERPEVIRAFAQCLGGVFKRISLTQDLMPLDITGSLVYLREEEEFEFQPGPIFTNYLYLRGVHNGPPRVRVALSDAMDANMVISDGAEYPLPDPFIVFATCLPEYDRETNPTYPLSPDELDLYLMRLRFGKRSSNELMAAINTDRSGPVLSVEPLLTNSDLVRLRNEVLDVAMPHVLLQYMLDIAEATNSSKHIRYGVAGRGVLMLAKAAKAYAYWSGRSFVIPDDIRIVAAPVLAHRIVLKLEAELDGIMGGNLMDSIIGSSGVPR